MPHDQRLGLWSRIRGKDASRGSSVLRIVALVILILFIIGVPAAKLLPYLFGRPLPH